MPSLRDCGATPRPAEPGMTLRDYFAAKAIQSVLLDPYFSKLAKEMGHCEFADDAAESAYIVAGAMLRAREVQL